MSFDSLDLIEPLRKAVRGAGYDTPTSIQLQAIPPVLAGKDVLGCAQTGTGKTAAFALPILQRLHLAEAKSERGRPLVLVLAPTRELAAQIDESFRTYAKFLRIRSTVVFGGVGYDKQTHALRDGVHVLVATPGRLMDLLDRHAVELSHIQVLVLDEADRMLDMGFLPDIRAILGRVPKQRQTQLFSATLHDEIERIASFAMHNPLRIQISKPTTVAEGIAQIAYPVIQSQKFELLETLLSSTEMKSVLVFMRTKHGADKVAKRLQQKGYRVGTLHSNKSQNQRVTAMEDFRHGRTQILVATDIAARGIDVRHISHVVNFDVPRHPEDYVHRVGRTARAYGVGDAITLYDPSEESFVRTIERFIHVVFPRAIVPNFQYNNPPRFPIPSAPHRPGAHHNRSSHGHQQHQKPQQHRRRWK